MEPAAGLRARVSVSGDPAYDGETVCEKRLKSGLTSPWHPLRLMGRLASGRGSCYTPLLVSLVLTTAVSLFYLARQPGRTGGVGLWEEGQEEEWSKQVGDRVRHKLERAREGEDHHVLDHEEEHWIQKTGLEILHDPDIISHLPTEEALNIAITLPFIDQQPLAAEAYMKMLEWITIYSSVRIHFHVITNAESEAFVDQIMSKVNLTSNCNFQYSLVTYDYIVDTIEGSLCKDIAVSHDYCNLLMGQLTPLLLPYLLPHLPYIVHIEKHITFHDDVGKLYNSLLKMDSKDEAIAMVQEQSMRYMRAFGTHHLKQPGSRLGQPPSRGHPGYNPDLLLLDLARLRKDPGYRTMLGELKLSLIIRKYSYHPESQVPSLGDVLNLMAAERPGLFHQLPCEWNKSSQLSTDPLMADFASCLEPHSRTVRATNTNPNLGPRP